MTRRIWVCAVLGVGLVGPLEPARAPARQIPGVQPPPPQPFIPGQNTPADLGQGFAPPPGIGPGQEPALNPGEALPPGAEVLARGPIHEAFATPVVFNPAPPLIVPKSPPPPIQEVPPDQRPEGGDVEWIPGYWAWDDDRQDFIWISGVWRDIPPGRQWIPGYWSEAQGGFGWTAGFWANADPTGGLDYLPAPPASLENGPNAPAPGPDFAWAPGQWAWQQTQYNWQPGYWYEARPNWVWNPANYQYTPSGYVYNSGYWDYNLPQRGLPFAPIGFNNPGAGLGFSGGGLGGFGGGGPFSYTPSYVLPVSGLLSSLFVRPNYGHYYFGDYYGASAQGLGNGGGYVPWFNFRNNRVGYDPIFSTLAARPGRPAGWDQVYRNEYQNRIEHPEFRPRPTFAAQQAFLRQQPNLAAAPGRPLGLVEPFRQWAGNPNRPHPIVPVRDDHRAEIQQRQNQLANFQRQRIEQEREGRQVEANRNLQGGQAQRALFRNELPRSPIAAAAEPRFGNRGPGATPGFPGNQANFRPQFSPQHDQVPVIRQQANAAHEQQIRELQAREQQARENQIRENQLRQQQGRENQLRQQQGRENQLREQQGRQQQHQAEQAREAERRQVEERNRREGGRPRR